MAIRNVFVTVNWLGKKAQNLPKGNKYITVAKFPDDINWLNDAWSVVLYFEKPPICQGNPSVAKAHFLVENAPHEKLMAGVQFELYEGIEKVAVVEVTSGGVDME